MIGNISEIIKKIAEKEKKRKFLSKSLRKKINDRIKVVEKREINTTIAGIDGGLLKKDFHLFDIIIRRAISVLFTYNKNKIKSVNYYPSLVKSDVLIYNGDELNTFANLKRVEIELETAIESWKKYQPSMILLDGSIVPHPSLHVSESSSLYDLYKHVLKLYQSLYKLSESCMIAGIVKDSRSKKITELWNKKFFDSQNELLKTTRDTNILFYILKTGERTEIIDYQNIENLETKKEVIEKWPIKSCYMKTAEHDRPIRIDFLAHKDKIDKLFSLIYTLCFFKQCAIPNILIEADKRARLSEKEFIHFKNILPLEIFGMRRNNKIL
ncbi:MAG: DNA double-strand break repair nuclease NurA [Candidatus Aenigmarchaeota archaeon]|nr:DNA double-strand break repair nuclease NurA [Candidatus Aenigmarchaeota archaeon]